MEKIKWNHDIPKEYLSSVEIKQLASTPYDDNPDVYRAGMFSIYTGLRRSDILALRWENIHHDRGRKAYIRFRIKKTGTLIQLPLSLPAIRVLGESKSEGKIFPMITESILVTHVDRWISKAKIRKHITFHVARHRTYSYILKIKSLQDLGLLISLIMNNKILNTVKKYNMLSLGDTVLVGCSGGADSMLLLSFLISIRDEYSLTLKVAHIEHGIRGQESLDDALFVEEYCRENNVEFNILHIDAVGEARENSLGIEEYSRNRRYEFFNSIPCDRIATAHNLSDNIETVLMRLGRGTGLKGACGIPPVRDKIIRPLIEISSSEIRQYCNEHNISYRVDSTNLENNYARNKIRNELIPVYMELFPELETALSAFILDACEDYSYIEKSAKLTLDKALENNKLNIQILRKTDASIQKRVINQYFLDNEITLDRIHLNDVFKLVHCNFLL